jgi:hypothetical protein
MTPKSTIALTAIAVLFAMSAATAKETGLPNVDIQKHCRSRAAATGDMMGDKTAATQAFDTCMRAERDARTALVAAWKDIPAKYKALCIKPDVFSASYEEWISCLELNIDVKNLRSKR